MFNNRVILLFLFLSALPVQAQIKKKPGLHSGEILNGRMMNDTLLNGKFGEERQIKLDKKAHYTDYKIISYTQDSTVVDTTLSLRKERLFNHLRKDLFAYQSLHNLGETYNHLAYDFDDRRLLPQMGIRAKHQDFTGVKDVKYYRVPTPTSELFFKTGIQQGQVLDALLTSNLSPEINLSIAYKGLRSLGNYRSALASHGQFRSTISLQRKDARYKARMHFVSHDLMNQENAGLTPVSLQYFLQNHPDFLDRERLEMNYQGAESLLKAKRFYLEQSYNLWQHQDTTHRLKNTVLQLGHAFVFTQKYYNFTQKEASSFIGESYQNEIRDSTYYKQFHNRIFTELQSPYVLGKIGLGIGLASYRYGYRSILFLENQEIPAQLQDQCVYTQAYWHAKLKKTGLRTAIGSTLKGRLKSNYLSGKAYYQKDSLLRFQAGLLIKSEVPNLNFLLYQSNYKDYNWQHNFRNENTQLLEAQLLTSRFGNYSVSSTLKQHYTYFNTLSQPEQYDGMVNYLKVEARKVWKYHKFTLDTRVLYQKVTHGSDVLHVPGILTENTLYFTDYVFKGDPLYLQTGMTLKYYTKYYADEFNPLLNEYRIQNQLKIGNYPYFDFFVNGQIRRTRLFFKAENIFSFINHNYLVTPTQAYRDFSIRFGLVWDFFI